MSNRSIILTHPNIMADWDHEKNNECDPANHTKTSKTVVWWKCRNGHSYQVSIHSRIRSGGCKLCTTSKKSENARRARLTTNSSLISVRPDLLNEWDYVKNQISPSEITYGSKYNVWWTCKDGHSWNASPASRVRGRNCPQCSKNSHGDRVRKFRLKKAGISLKEAYPSLMKEWDFDLNEMNPENMTPKSGYKARWICKFGHKWKASVVNRTHAQSNCPFCTSQTSKLEIFLYCEFLSLFEKVTWRKKLNGLECDILVEDIDVGVEIDGGYWHRNKIEKDISKSLKFKDMGIDLYRVRDESLPFIEGNVVTFGKMDEYIDVMIKLLKIVSLNHHINLNDYIQSRTQKSESEYRKILAYLPAPPAESSLLFEFPSIAKEWNFVKNNPLKPEMFSSGSEHRVHWICNEGHEWITSIKNRTRNNSICPNCSKVGWGEKIRVIRLEKSGKTVQNTGTELLDEWDYEKNSIQPSEVAPNSKVEIWWKCKLGHSYLRSVSSKKRGDGCPECSPLKRSNSARLLRLNKTGSLKDKFPEIAQEWDLEKNTLSLDEVPCGSKYDAWWICRNGHSYNKKVSARTRLFQSCPTCYLGGLKEKAIKLAIERCGSFYDTGGDLLNEWDSEKNLISPKEITKYYKKKVWWNCLDGHSFEMSPNDRSSGHGCPVCGKAKAVESYKRKILLSRGSLSDNFPEILKYWDYEKNINIDPEQITSSSHAIASWSCECGHKWQESINRITDKRRQYVCIKCKRYV